MINQVSIDRIGHEFKVQVHTNTESIYADGSNVEVVFEAEPADPGKAVPIRRKIIEIRVRIKVDGITHGSTP